MITDLRNGSVVAIQRQDAGEGFLKVSINCIGSTKCDLVDFEGNEYKVSYDQIFPIKITKRWLKNNDFNCVDEGEEESNYIHQFLPVTYLHSEHKLFIYGHIFPIKVKFVHHFQNALLDCGIKFPVDLKESHYTQVELIPIINLLGGLKKSREFFDTNAAFGLSSMPKIGLNSVGTAISGDRRRKMGLDPVSIYKGEFTIIDGIDSYRNQRNLARFFYDTTIVDSVTNKIVPCYLVKNQDVYQICGDPSFRGPTMSIDLDDFSTFIANFNNYVRGSYRIGLVLIQEGILEEINEYINQALFIGRILTETSIGFRPRFLLNRGDGNRTCIKCCSDGKEYIIFSEEVENLRVSGILDHVRLSVVSRDEYVNYTPNNENDEFRSVYKEASVKVKSPEGLNNVAKKYILEDPLEGLNYTGFREREDGVGLGHPVNNEVEEVELPNFDVELDIEHAPQGPAVADRVEAVNKELKKSKKKRRI